MKNLQKSLVAISLLSVASFVQATEEESFSQLAKGLYAGFNVGQAKYDAKLNDFRVLDDGSITSAKLDDTDTAYSFLLGYKIIPYFAVEGGYLNLGDLTVKANSNGTGSLYAPGNVDFKISVDGFFLDTKGILPLNEKFNLFGKFGVFFYDVDGKLSDSTGSVKVSDDDNDVFYGAGASFNVNTKIALNVDITRYKLDSENVDVISAGVQFGF